MIFNVTGGGGTKSELNFGVLAYDSEESLLAATPAANTIGVITDTPISTYIFDMVEPAGSEGSIWIQTGTSSSIQFNALKNNQLVVYPLKVKQFVGGEWTIKEAMSYIDDTWVKWTYETVTANATDIYVGDFQNGEEYVKMTPLTSSSWTPVVGGKWSSSDWVTVIKFTIASACTSFTLSMCSKSTNSYAASIKYKVTSAEDTSLQSATYMTDGDGSFTVSTGNWVRTTATIEKSLQAGTHYLYLWSGRDTASSPSNYYTFNAASGGEYGLTITYDTYS